MIDDTTTLQDTGVSTDTSTSADTGLDFDIGTGADTGTDVQETPQDGQQRPLEGDRTQDQQKDEPEVQDFRGHVSNRIRNLDKQTQGELSKILVKYPKVRDAIEAPLRREAAYRDAFQTVAEAKAMRERFPNGLQDVQALEDDAKEIDEVDRNFEGQDSDGNFPGHPTLIQDWHKRNPQAALALLRTIPKEWARLDRNSYNDVMGNIVGATLIGTGSWEQLIELRDHAAATEGLKAIVPALDKVLNRLSPFVEERRPDPNKEALDRDRQQLQRDRQQTEQQTNQQFNRTFQTEGVKQQREIVNGHRVMQKLAAMKTITPQKRAEITDKVCLKMQAFLKNSPSFMRKITAAYQSRNLDEALNVQRAGWSQEWLLNRMIRDVLKVETPQLINSNRTTVQNRTGIKPPVKAPADNGKGKPTGPFQENGQWFHADGRRMTTVEAMKQAMASS